jgi:hypothetical protein
MKQENGIYIADEGKVFQRTYDGFKKLNPPIGYFNTLKLGKILTDSNGNLLDTPIDDKIQYYEEIEYTEDNPESNGI